MHEAHNLHPRPHLVFVVANIVQKAAKGHELGHQHDLGGHTYSQQLQQVRVVH